MSFHQNAGHHHDLLIGNKSFENVAKLKFLGTIIASHNFIHKEIKSKLNSGNACCHSVQNFLSSCLISDTLKIKNM